MPVLPRNITNVLISQTSDGENWRCMIANARRGTALADDETVKHKHAGQKEKGLLLTGRNMTTFDRLQRKNSNYVKKMAEKYGLGFDLVHNVFTYSKCLPKASCTDIEETVFMAQMGNHFDITSVPMLELMYNALKGLKSPCVQVEDFCRCICVFLSSDLETKINFTFQVYDINGDGTISFLEMYSFLKTSLTFVDSDTDDMADTEESLRHMIGMVLRATDDNLDGTISLDEFRNLVEKDNLYLQLLGPCLPSEAAIQKFESKMTGISPLEIKRQFELERYKCLNEPIMPSRKETLFPIRLDLP